MSENGSSLPISRQEIKRISRDCLQANRGSCIGVYVLLAVCTAIAATVPIGLLAIFITPVLMVSGCLYYQKNYLGEKPTVSDCFGGTFDNYLRKLGGMLWMYLWELLWSFLFIIPGIVKSLAYMMTPYILGAHPNVTAKSALRLSMRITDGYKMDLFVAVLSFLGWELLSALTFGILEILFVGPYRSITFAGIYSELEKSALERDIITPEMLDGTVEVY